MGTDGPLRALTFAVGIRVGRAEAHQALPVGSQQLLAGAEGLESLQAKSSPTPPPPNPAAPAAPSTHRVVGDPAEDDGPGEGEPGREQRDRGGPQRAPGAEPPPNSEGTGAAPLTRLSPPPHPRPGAARTAAGIARGSRSRRFCPPCTAAPPAHRPPACNGSALGADPSSGSSSTVPPYRPPLPAARTACEPGPGPGQGQEHRQQPPRRRHGSDAGTTAPGMHRTAPPPRYGVRRGTHLKGATP